MIGSIANLIEGKIKPFKFNPQFLKNKPFKLNPQFQKNILIRNIAEIEVEYPFNRISLKSLKI
jgi:hypothetical protein